ncbi:MAG TPA: UPF0182 family protein [Terracidiphilus sp.]|nr:UPF0182 family protein [Terracidiphilus sp.]
MNGHGWDGGEIHEPAGWPRKTRSERRRNARFLLIAAILFVALLGSQTALTYWVDLLWFRSLGYGQTLLRMLGIQWGVFAAFAAATFAILYAGLRLLLRIHRYELPQDHTVAFGRQEFQLSVRSVLRILSLIGSVLIALVSGAAMMAQWPKLVLYWYAPKAAGGPVDPVFGKPLHFFLFTLPAWNAIANWLFGLAVLLCLAAGALAMLAGGSRAMTMRSAQTMLLPWRGLCAAFTFLLAVLAVREYLGRFAQIFIHHTIFDGINYTDAHVRLNGMLAISIALAVGAAIAGVSAVRSPRGRWLVAAVAPAVICFVAVGVVAWYVNGFIVKPNELVREKPYIANNIAMTRQAFGLDRFNRREFPAETTVAAIDAANNQPTLNNIRLWDWRALQDTLRQIQEIRTYYDFPDIDIDRYMLDGRLREVMVAARELNQNKLPVSSRNWINDKLIYTHGYGVTMNSVNGFTSEGLPKLMLSNMPVESAVPGLKVTRPEIYFGELTNSDVYVKTRQKEFNYPEGQDNNLTTYNGTGGIVMGGFVRRVLLAFARGDLAKVPFSDDITPESRLLMRRNVSDRVAALAPFLTFERDPYLVVGNDGRLYWMLDGFTTSGDYPYSSHYQFEGQSINYVRNSVKAVVDAYDGTTTFYVFDATDPIIAAYQRVFPGMFKDASAMPQNLRQHVRYPEWLLQLQAAVYGLYHMTDPEVFYNREDLWTVANEVGMSGGGEQATMPMEPNFVLMKLPGETSEEFAEILPFTPANRNNLIGWIAGRSDGANYGTAAVYDFPKTKLVDGPLQIEARIDQNAEISGQLTLWNQQGSHVRRGNLLVIPSGHALLYAEPIYLQAEHSPMPELRLVVLAIQDKLAYGPTYQDALNALFGGGASSLTGSGAAQDSDQALSNSSPAPSGSATAPTSDLQGLIAKAARDFDEYQQLTAQGKMGEAGKKLDELKNVLKQLSTHAQ